MDRTLALPALFVSVVFLAGCGPTAQQRQLKGVIDAHVAKVKPLSTEANLAYWDAATTGKGECYDRFSELQLQIGKLYSDPQDFAFIKDIKESGRIKDIRLARQLDKLYFVYMRNQVEPNLLEEIVGLRALPDVSRALSAEYRTCISP